MKKTLLLASFLLLLTGVATAQTSIEALLSAPFPSGLTGSPDSKADISIEQFLIDELQSVD